MAELSEEIDLVFIDSSERLGVQVLVLSGRFEVEDAANFLATLGEARPSGKVIVDLYHLDFISLAGVSAVARLGMYNPNVIFLAPASDQVIEKLEITSTFNLLTFSSTIGEALSALGVK